jgi:hypothetical protein
MGYVCVYAWSRGSEQKDAEYWVIQMSLQPVPCPILAAICSEQPAVWEWRVSMGTSVEITKRMLWQPARGESRNQVELRVTDLCVQ